MADAMCSEALAVENPRSSCVISGGARRSENARAREASAETWTLKQELLEGEQRTRIGRFV